MPDGAMEVYGLSDGATTSPRFMFLTQIIDPMGNTTTLSYDSQFRLTSVTDATGRSTTFTYGLAQSPLLITRITDAFGRFSQLTYDANQRLSSITDPIGITSEFTYGSTAEPDFITSMRTPYGTSKFSDTPNPHDPMPFFARSLAVTDPLGYVDFLYFYQDAGTKSSETVVPTGMSNDSGILQWRNTYYWDRHAAAQGVTTDANGNPTAENFAYSDIYHWMHFCCSLFYTSNTLGGIKKPLEKYRLWMNYPGMATTGYYYYSGSLLKPSATGRVLDDGTTQLSTVTYNPMGNPLSRTDPNLRKTQFTYAANNIDLLTVQQLTTAPSAYTTIATFGNYNAQHEPQSYAGPDGQTWRYTYNTAGQISTVTDPNSGVTTYNYDTLGRLTTIQNANLQTALTLTYDSADRVQSRTDSEGYMLTYAYDNLDRVTSITYPDGTTDLYDYTFQTGTLAGAPSLDLRKHTDRLGNITIYAYDADRRLTSVTEPITSSTSRTTSYDYYENGTLKDIIDANGNVTHWAIDIQSRPISKTYAFGTANAQTETYAYENTNSRLHSITDALGQVKTFTYGHDDRVTGITYTNTVNPTPNVTFTYDTYFPRLTAMTDGSGTTNYGYYPAAGLGGLRLQTEATPFTNGTIAYAYDALSRLASRTVDTSIETFAYDKISRLITHGTTLGMFNLGYLGQTSQLTSQQISTGTVGTTWTYDTNINDRRLKAITNSAATRSFKYTTTPENLITQIQETAPQGSAWPPQTWNYSYDDIYRLTQASSSVGTYSYGLDPVDNITSMMLPSGTTTASYNSLNEIVNFGSNAYVYDNNGNLLDDGTRTYTWDVENRLLSITSKTNSSLKTTFRYDGLGRRIAIDTGNGGIVTETRHLWCGESLCQARTSADVVERRYYSEGEYLPLGGTSLYYSQDQLGSVRDVLAAQNGTRVASFDYDPYGNPSESNGRVSTDFRYARLFYDQQDGLYLTHYRAYEPSTGRWLSRDPLGSVSGSNAYPYAEDGPTIAIDPRGLESIGTALKLDIRVIPPVFEPQSDFPYFIRTSGYVQYGVGPVYPLATDTFRRPSNCYGSVLAGGDQYGLLTPIALRILSEQYIDITGQAVQTGDVIAYFSPESISHVQRVTAPPRFGPTNYGSSMVHTVVGENGPVYEGEAASDPAANGFVRLYRLKPQACSCGSH
jgi:RHS repeat-associated protein